MPPNTPPPLCFSTGGTLCLAAVIASDLLVLVFYEGPRVGVDLVVARQMQALERRVCSRPPAPFFYLYSTHSE
jgi:hypothetical protein